MADKSTDSKHAAGSGGEDQGTLARHRADREDGGQGWQAQPDFEEELARVIGDVAARQVANVARSFLGWSRKASDSLATSVVEYLQEEGRDLPTRVEVEEFLAGVDRLRDDAERLEVRLARLERK